MTAIDPTEKHEAADLQTGVGRLVVGLVETLRLVIEAQAVNRFEEGSLTETEERDLGEALAALEAKMPELRRLFDLPENEEARLSLGRVEGVELDLAEALDRLVETGVVLRGDAVVTLARVALIEADLSVHLRAAARRPIEPDRARGVSPTEP